MPATTALLLPGMDGTGALFGPFVEVLHLLPGFCFSGCEGLGSLAA